MSNPAYDSQPCPVCGTVPEGRAGQAAEVLALSGISPGGFA